MQRGSTEFQHDCSSFSFVPLASACQSWAPWTALEEETEEEEEEEEGAALCYPQHFLCWSFRMPSRAWGSVSHT